MARDKNIRLSEVEKALLDDVAREEYGEGTHENIPYGETIRMLAQRYLDGSGGETDGRA